jgi:hypothetical protein
MRTETLVVVFEEGSFPNWIMESFTKGEDINGVKVIGLHCGNLMKEQESFFIKVSSAWDEYKNSRGEKRQVAEDTLDDLLDSM